MKRGKVKRGKVKRGKVKRDFISNLDNSILLFILSFLNTKHAVQTCALSKRWEHLWKSLPVLRFDDCFHLQREEEDEYDEDYGYNEEDYNDATNRFTRFIDKVLRRRVKNCDIHSLYILCQRYYLIDEYHKVGRCITRCIKYAVKNKVQEIHIQTNTLEDFEIPVCLAACKSLRMMDISLYGDRGTRIILPREVNLPCLKSLSLSIQDMPFNDEELTNRFFASLPALETLVILFHGLGSGFANMGVRISLPELRRFKLGGSDYVNNGKLTLNAPRLSSLDLGVPSSTQLMAGFLRGIHSVKSLCLHGSVLENFGAALDILGTNPLELKNLQHLELKAYLSMDCMRSMFYILEKSPNVVSVAVRIPEDSETVSMEHSTEDYWDVGSFSPRTTCQLKFVEINGILGFANEVKFVEILLKHAMVLEKLTLRSEEDSEMVMNFREKVREFPKASKEVLILFKF